MWKVRKSEREELLDQIEEDIVCDWWKYEDSAIALLLEHYRSIPIEELRLLASEIEE